jgi:sulfur carrier protein ThiS
VTSAAIPVFLNGRPARVEPGTTLAQLVDQEDPALARAWRAGAAVASDGRGVAAPADTVLSAGAIFRVVVSSRTGAGDA